MTIITYGNYREFANLKHGKHNGELLVFGFMVTSFDDDGGAWERRFAVHSDGRIKETNIEPAVAREFDAEGTIWNDTNVVPEHAEWIGQYINTMFK